MTYRFYYRLELVNYLYRVKGYNYYDENNIHMSQVQNSV